MQVKCIDASTGSTDRFESALEINSGFSCFHFFVTRKSFKLIFKTFENVVALGQVFRETRDLFQH